MGYYLSCCCLCGDHGLLIVFKMRSQMRRTFNIYHRGVPCNPLWLTWEVVPLSWDGLWPTLLVLKTDKTRRKKLLYFGWHAYVRDQVLPGVYSETKYEDGFMIHILHPSSNLIQKSQLSAEAALGKNQQTSFLHFYSRYEYPIYW